MEEIEQIIKNIKNNNCKSHDCIYLKSLLNEMISIYNRRENNNNSYFYYNLSLDNNLNLKSEYTEIFRKRYG